MYDDQERPSDLLLIKKRIFNSALRVTGFRTTGLFTDVRTFVKLCSAGPPRPEIVELMTHPGSDPLDDETSLVESDWMARLSYRAALVSYGNL
jgi:hypothetical protein